MSEQFHRAGIHLVLRDRVGLERPLLHHGHTVRIVVAKGIPSIVVAAASMDDVVAMLGFSVCIEQSNPLIPKRPDVPGNAFKLMNSAKVKNKDLAAERRRKRWDESAKYCA